MSSEEGGSEKPEPAPDGFIETDEVLIGNGFGGGLVAMSERPSLWNHSDKPLRWRGLHIGAQDTHFELGDRDQAVNDRRNAMARSLEHAQRTLDALEVSQAEHERLKVDLAELKTLQEKEALSFGRFVAKMGIDLDAARSEAAAYRDKVDAWIENEIYLDGGYGLVVDPIHKKRFSWEEK